MPTYQKLSRDHTALLMIDVQEKLFPYIENSCQIVQAIQKVLHGFKILKIPIYASEQYPQGLGATVAPLKGILGEQQPFWIKTAFSCLDDEKIRAEVQKMGATQWVLIGIEAHVCVLQTAKDLLQLGKQVTVLNDAIGSRSIYDFSTAIAEMRDAGIRISSTETILFELLRNSKVPEFKEISLLIK